MVNQGVSYYPTINVLGSSEDTLVTNLSHDDGIVGFEIGDTGVLWTNLNLVCFLQISRYGTPLITMTWQQMAFVQAGIWTFTYPATAVPTRQGPWIATVEGHTIGGVGGDPKTLIGSILYNLCELDTPITP